MAGIKSDSRDKKRKKIIETAAKEFVKKGYQRANINHIAEMSGIGKGTIYLYFKNKEDLYIQALRESNDAWMEKAKAIVESEGDSLEALVELLKLDVLLGVRHKELAQLWITSFFGDNRHFAGTAASVLQEYYQLVEDLVKKCIEEGVFRDVDPVVTSYMLLGFSELTIAFYDTLFRQLGDVELVFAKIADVMLNGLKARQDREVKPASSKKNVSKKARGKPPANT
ncbi:MAG: TetR/AcrR family transcriptional regulator [Actinobacteria bacterium]|nr:TetR/AcrR family transcriptional regulator [Actinomycetota bacterium]